MTQALLAFAPLHHASPYDAKTQFSFSGVCGHGPLPYLMHRYHCNARAERRVCQPTARETRHVESGAMVVATAKAFSAAPMTERRGSWGAHLSPKVLQANWHLQPPGS